MANSSRRGRSRITLVAAVFLTAAVHGALLYGVVSRGLFGGRAVFHGYQQAAPPAPLPVPVGEVAAAPIPSAPAPARHHEHRAASGRAPSKVAPAVLPSDLLRYDARPPITRN